MHVNRHLRRARRHARLGLPLAPGTKHRGLKRIIVKLTWFTTSHQMDHNLAMVKAANALAGEISSLREEMMSHRHHVSQVLAGIEASLRAEIAGADRRGDQTESDLVRLSATVAALQLRLQKLSDDISSDSEQMDTESRDPDVAEVRSLPGQARR